MLGLKYLHYWQNYSTHHNVGKSCITTFLYMVNGVACRQYSSQY
uniref:Uncharacterized protein n=1 Tax=Arundo donax TaxID=35708 RepID=A0A0A9FSH3_ARUDO